MISSEMITRIFLSLLLLPSVLWAAGVQRLSPDLKVGDVVFRRGDGAWTQYFIDCSSREKRFSHVGIVLSNNNEEVVIVHADADDWTGVGKVRTENWKGFFAGAAECAVFRYDGEAKIAEKIAANAARRIGTAFDFFFDLSETNRLYCTELVRLAINEAVGTNFVGTTKVCGTDVVAIDDIYRKGFKRVFDSKWSNGSNNNQRKVKVKDETR